jgi:hypothetical protein
VPFVVVDDGDKFMAILEAIQFQSLIPPPYCIMANYCEIRMQNSWGLRNSLTVGMKKVPD